MKAEFPPLADIVALGPTEYEQAFLRFEFEPGLDYYLNRLDRLQLAGGSLLDAGCGAGQWALAAASRFERVACVDVSPVRLATLSALAARMEASNLRLALGSVDRLPYAAASFDALICYGVIMFTDVRRALEEFARVLRPGGRAYVCLNADGWSRYLIEERGAHEPKVLSAGQQTLYNTYWRRAIADGVLELLARAATACADVRRVHEELERQRLPSDDLTPRDLERRFGRMFLLGSRQGEQLLRSVEASCGETLSAQVLDDAWACGSSGGRPTRMIPSEAFQPDEFRDLAEAAGFASVEWAPEAELVCSWLLPAPAPKYAGYYDGELSIWEVLMTKPDRRPPSIVDLERHYKAARVARDERLFIGPAPLSVVSNASRSTYPSSLVSHAEQVGVRLGGDAYLDRLVHTILDDAPDDEARVRRLIVFVQRSIFRDPVSQPLTPSGHTPDALTMLLCARGRCGHTTNLLVDLFTRAGFEARVRQLANHVAAEVLLAGRWVVADADAFKSGIVPVNRSGALLTFEEIEADPYQLDRFPPVGWSMWSASRFARGAAGGRVVGYVDALDPDVRGFVSGYYVPAAKGYPPSLPKIASFTRREGRAVLEWAPSTCPSSRYVGYTVAVGSRSRGWVYDDDEIIPTPPPDDVFRADTRALRVEWPAGDPTAPMFASVTAYSDRIEIEPQTWFWPSEEARLDA